MNSLTILVPTRNRPDDLRCCLGSILTAFGPGQLVVIGDNGDAETTKSIIDELPDLKITHLKNPPGNTYVKNIQTLIDTSETEWLSIIHDDDYFNPGVPNFIEPFFSSPAVEFIFSDHWVCDHNGIIDQVRSEENTRHYGRDTLSPGPQSNLGILAVNRSICLDGFFIRTSLARSVRLDLTSPTYSDMRWLIEVCERAKLGTYIPNRLFTYRRSVVSLTSSTPALSANLDRWRSLRRVTVRDPQTRRQLRRQTFLCLFDILKSFAKQPPVKSRSSTLPLTTTTP